jgi:hypothetical protein
MRKEDKDFFESMGINLYDGMGYAYNRFAISEGILIAEILRDKDKIMEFSNLSFDEQRKIVPISDNHSGGTWGIAIRAAIVYLKKIKIDDRDDKIDKIMNYTMTKDHCVSEPKDSSF